MQGWRGYKPLLFVFQEHLQCFVLKALYYLVKSAQKETLFCHCHHNDGTNLSVSVLCSLYVRSEDPTYFLLSPPTGTEWGVALPNGNDNCSKEIKSSRKTPQEYSDKAGPSPAPKFPLIPGALLRILQVEASQVSLDAWKFWIPAGRVFSDPKLAHLCVCFLKIKVYWKEQLTQSCGSGCDYWQDSFVLDS